MTEPRPAVRSSSSRLLASFRSAASAGETASTLRERVLRRVAFGLACRYAELVRRVAGHEIFLPTDHIEWVAQLESHWRVIRDELDQLRGCFAMPALIDVIAGERGVADARWRAFLFCYFGKAIDPNCSLCPRTAALLRGIPGLLSAEFSVLEPGARIAPHHGIYAGTLRYHLGLIVPQEGDLCGLRVEDETRRWREGASLLFDDTRQHEAWNLAKRDRVVLLLDVKRRLPAPLSWLNDALLLVLSRFVMPPLVRVDRAIPTVTNPAVAGSMARPLPTD